MERLAGLSATRKSTANKSRAAIAAAAVVLLALPGCCGLLIPSVRLRDHSCVGDGCCAVAGLPAADLMEPEVDEPEPPIGSGVLKPPFPRFHPVPTQPVFAPRQEYSPPQPLAPTPAAHKPSVAPLRPIPEELPPQNTAAPDEADSAEPAAAEPVPTGEPAEGDDTLEPRTALNPPVMPVVKIDSVRFAEGGASIPPANADADSRWRERAPAK